MLVFNLFACHVAELLGKTQPLCPFDVVFGSCEIHIWVRFAREFQIYSYRASERGREDGNCLAQQTEIC